MRRDKKSSTGIFRRLYDAIGPRLSAYQKAWIRAHLEQLFKAGRTYSYSQFGEDSFVRGYFEAKVFRQGGRGLPLSRTGLPPGFYVDVGAYSPKQYSNTYSFYKRGWRGINIDATEDGIKAFQRIRPRDINVEAVVSDSEKVVDFYWWSIPGVVNTLSREHAEKWTREFGKEPQVRKVRTTTLERLLDRFLPAGQRIDFMSVDVEGHDFEVLRSNNWTKYRPEIVLVEKDVVDPSEILNLPLTRFMAGAHYDLYSWLRPNLVFRDKENEI